MSWFLNLFLKRTIISHFVFIAVVVFGFIAIKKLPVENNPEVNFDFAVIVTMYPGASAEEIERLLTIPIEDAIANVEDIERIGSRSQNGRSFLFIRFEDNVEDYDQRIVDLQTEINKISNLPSKDEMAGPFVYKIGVGDTSPIINVMLSSSSIDEKQFKSVVEILKRDISKKIPDVKNIEVAGIADYEITVNLNNRDLILYNLTLEEVLAVIVANNFRIPGGEVKVTGESFLIRTVGNIKSIDQIKDIVVKTGRNGEKLYLSDVANIEKREKGGSVYSFLNGKQSVSLYIIRRKGGNVVEISDDVKKVVKKFCERYPNLDYSFRNDEGVNVNKSITMLRDNALLGMVLVGGFLFLFMGWRAAFLAIIGIPFAFLATFLLMYFFDYTINSLSLFAMILVSGMLVDDAIVVIENVYRYREEGFSPYDAALKGTKEIIIPVISAVLTTIAAFLPLLMIRGMVGKFLAVLPVVVTLTLIASLIEAMVILPVHLYEMKKLYKEKKRKFFDWWGYLLVGYRKLLNYILSLRYYMFFVFLPIALVISLSLAKEMKIVMFGAEITDKLNAKIVLSENTSIDVTKKIVQEIENFINKNLKPDKIKAFVTVIGRVIEDRRWITKENVAELRIDLPKEDLKLAQDVKRELRKKVADIPEIVEFEFFVNSGNRPTGRAIDLSIAGEDSVILEKIAKEIIAYLEGVEGVVDVNSSILKTYSELIVVPNREVIRNLNIPISKVARILRSFTSGSIAGKYLDKDGRELNIWVRMDDKKSYTLNDIKNIPVIRINNKLISLGDIAIIKEVQSLSKIRREDRVREVRVVGNVDYSKITPNKINDLITEKFVHSIPEKYPGYNLNFRGEKEDQDKAFFDVMVSIITALLLIFTILGIQFNSFFQPFIVLLTVPFAVIGVVVGLHVSNLPISLVAAISLVALTGIVVNDSIIMVDFINKNLDKEYLDSDFKINIPKNPLFLIISGLVISFLSYMGHILVHSNDNKILILTIILSIFATIITLFSHYFVDKNGDNNRRFALVDAGGKRLRPIILTTLTTIGGLVPMAFFLTGSSKTWQPMAITLIWGLIFATTLTLFIIPIVYSLLSDLKMFFKFILRGLLYPFRIFTKKSEVISE